MPSLIRLFYLGADGDVLSRMAAHTSELTRTTVSIIRAPSIQLRDLARVLKKSTWDSVMFQYKCAEWDREALAGARGGGEEGDLS